MSGRKDQRSVTQILVSLAGGEKKVVNFVIFSEKNPLLSNVGLLFLAGEE